MYNKTASIILNSGKAEGLSDVYVAQPDALKENLAGKIFVLAEIGGKKSDGRKILDFLVRALTDNYYNDEKILFRDKIVGLKIENIFEAAVTKTNDNLEDFLLSEKIRLNPSATNITIGVIYENKLHFANFGRNRALLVYRRGSEYELINVEANATESARSTTGANGEKPPTPKLFSSVISGEVPNGSYFVFTSEALPEYLSGKEMINIITKLPPLVAAEQIKNVLGKINNYVPFLGIIIKNTTGQAGQEIKEEPEEISSAQGSISSLNYTEQKTEAMLASAGLINFFDFFKRVKDGAEKLINKVLPPLSSAERVERSARSAPTERDRQPALDLGAVRSLNSVRADSFLIKEKIYFKKKTSAVTISLRKIIPGLLNIFDLRLWAGFYTSFRNWLRDLNLRNRWLFAALGLVVVIFAVSLSWTNWHKQRRLVQTNFDNLTAAITEKENSLDSHLLYNDEAGAGTVLIEAQVLLSSLPRETKEQQAAYQLLDDKLRGYSERLQKIIRVSQTEKVNDLAGLGVNNLVWSGGKLYGAAAKVIYNIASTTVATTTEISAATDLSRPLADKDLIYYWDNNRVIQFNVKTKAVSIFTTNNLDQTAGLTSFKIYNDRLYQIAKNKNQIYRYNKIGTGFGTKSDWLKTPAELSAASDLYVVDGDIYVLLSTGQVRKFRANEPLDYQSLAIQPVMAAASKLIVGANNIYIFEGGSKRLVVLAKNDDPKDSSRKGGRLLNQYQFDSLDQPLDFAVDETGKIAYILDGETVYKINLKQ